MDQNKIIIDQFEKLVEKIKVDIDHSLTKNDKIKHGYRLKQIKNALSIIKKYDKKINSGEDLEDIKGIGKGTIERINEILKTNKLSEIVLDDNYEKNKNAIEELEKVFGIGRATAYDYVMNKNIDSVKKLKDEFKKGNITLPDQIQMGLKYHGVFQENIPRAEIDNINNLLQKVGKSIDKDLIITISGSYRRLLPTSNDVDVLLSHPSINHTIEFVKKLKDQKFIVDDLTDKDYVVKYMGFCKYNNNPVRRIDVKFVNFESYYTALLHFTGSWKFNEQIRSLAQHLGYMLNEYGLYKLDKDGNKETKIKINSEKDVFDVLGLEYIEPSLRDKH